jgi:Zn-dependent protease with chaperone function
MDFFAHQDAARRKSALLVAYFALALALIVAAVYAVVGFLAHYFGDSYAAQHAYREDWWDPVLLAWVAAGVLGVVGLGTAYKVLSLRSGGAAVAQALGGTPVSPATRDAGERRLLNVVEEMAIASGLRVPEVYVLKDEPGINAFAAGLGPNDAVVAVTRGCLEGLGRDELQGVIAHEFSHIFHGDTRLNLRLIGILHGILLIGLVGQMLMRGGALGSRRWTARSGSRRGSGAGIVLLGVAVWLIGSVGVLFANLIKAAVSRQREFLADASAVQYTRNPAGIAGALKKIGAAAGGSLLGARRAAEASHMYFAAGLGSYLRGLLATHPPLAERIRRIEPGFDGRFAVPVPGVAPLATGAPSSRGWHEPAGLAPAALVARVGEPAPAQLDHAERLMAALDPVLRQAAREPFAARALVYALLLSDDPQARGRQVDHLRRAADPKVYAELRRLVAAAKRLPAEQRLPLADLALPALRWLSPDQYRSFRGNLKVLIEADGRVSLFEYALHRLLLRHLDPLFQSQRRAERRPAHRRRHHLEALKEPAAVVLCALAHAGHSDPDEAASAYAAARDAFGPIQVPDLPPPDACSIAAVDRALADLEALVPDHRRRLLQAAAASVAHDGHVRAAEAELLRAIADALDLPVPPLPPAESSSSS